VLASAENKKCIKCKLLNEHVTVSNNVLHVIASWYVCGCKTVIMKLKFKILMCRTRLSGYANHGLMSSSAGCTRGLCIMNTRGNMLTVQRCD
jgi:hypothetical protein